MKVGTSGVLALDSRQSRLPYLPGLDGLRALAVTSVFAYHADVAWIPGGFLGVDVFFVISGYLITALLLAEWQRTGSIDLLGFWRRRALRLLPAMITMLVAVGVVVPWLAPEQMGRMGGDFRAALTYVSNWRLIFEDQSYFEAVGRPPLLQHLWSLAVEEQFYLLWPVVLPLLLRRRLRSLRLAGYLMAGACGSTLLMAALFTPSADPSRAYYGTDTRVAAILVGAALASVWAPWRVPRATPRSAGVFLKGVLLASVTGLGLIVTTVDRYDASLYRGGFAAVAVLSAVAVAVIVHPSGLPKGTLLASRQFLWLGRRSYGVYLWHWPVFMVTRPGLDVPIDGLALLVLRCGLTLGLAAVSYRFVELPVQQGALGRLWTDLRSPTWLKSWAGQVVAARAMAVALLLAGLVAVNAVNPGATPSADLDAVSAVSSPLDILGTDGGSAPPPAVPEVVETVPEPAVVENPALVAVSVTTPVPTPVPTVEIADPAAVAPPLVEPVPVTEAPAVAVAASGPVTAIGDSVLLAAKPALEAALPGIAVDAVIGRQIRELITLAEQLRDSGGLAPVVVVQAGNNGPVSEGDIDRLLDILGSARKVLVVNVEVPRPWESSNNENMAEAVRKHANAVLVDWHGAAAGAGAIFYKDGTHLKPAGIALYTGLIRASI